MTGDGLRLEQTILDLLATRARGATICPSDAARGPVRIRSVVP
jgi:hypothetical protein